jgi:hypothetical protein
LVNESTAPSVSIYLPTKRGGPESDENRIRLKNLIARTEAHLQDWGLRPAEVRQVVEPIHGLIGENDLRQPKSDGLALLRTFEQSWRFYLPHACAELALVGERFHIKPLLPLLSDNERFFLLTLAQNGVRLFTGDRSRLEELDVPRLPADMPEALRFDDDEKQLQFHTRAQAATGKRPAVFHGHNVAKDNAKKDLLRYAQRVDRAIAPVLKAQPAPLVLATVDYVLPIYREANTYGDLVSEAVPGNPQKLSREELHARAWKLVEPRYSEGIELAVDRYRAALAKGQASHDVVEVVRNANVARLDSLLVALDRHEWGRFDAATGQVTTESQPGPRSEDLLNLAAIETLRHGGAVHAMSAETMPDDASIAAVFRY